jgi:predicted ribosome quality control (RQC) complex YloA/Tae2 family protein
MPPADPGIPFVELTAEALAARLASHDGPLHRRIPRGWGGGSTGFARVLEATRADFPARLLDLAAAARPPRPRLARRPDDAAHGELVVFPADPGPLSGWEVLPETSANDTADRFYRPLEESATAGALFAELRRALVRRRSRAAKALVHVARRITESADADLVREWAELLSANLAQVRKGQKRVALPAFDGTREVVIELDSTLEPHENVEALFKRARRLARGREDLAAQRAGLEQEIEAADRALAALDPTPPPARVLELAREHAPSLLAPRPGDGPAPAGKAAAKSPRDGRGGRDAFNPRVYVLPGGWEVWVGRSAKQNDELTHRRAAPRDLWFHARGCEGSHAVLRLASGKGEPPREIIEAAAAIAAFHSKARNSKLVPVAWTERRHVRKPRGAPVGTASIQREKVMFVEPRTPVPQESHEGEALR